MAELLFEIFSEEIPARMQAKAGADLVKLMDAALSEAGLSPEGSTAMTGPRRLTYLTEVETRSPDVSEERKGPRVGAPEQALAGFMRGAGLSDISEAETREDKKGEFYVAVIKREGRDTADILREAIPAVMGRFPWPKCMKSGNSDFRWVRPLRGLTVLLDGTSVDGIEVGGIVSDAHVHGHRQMGPGPFTVGTAADYRSTLEGEGSVVLEREDRKARILEQARAVCANAGLELVEDIGLLEEVAGLVEYPVVLLGDMDEVFLSLPDEVIRLTLKSHQKTFTVRGKDGALAPHFVLVANLETPDNGATIKAGNAKVIGARLSDAKFFQDEDRKRPLASYYDQLDTVVFHKKLGSLRDKAERVAALAREIAPKVGADPDVAEAAARLAKCDLVTQTVIEMTSLQGQVGRMMLDAEGKDTAVALAVEEHYKPQGPSDSVPRDPLSVAVALADKIDTLVGFWAIDEKPTGSKDPFGLRRASLGVVRLLLENTVSISLLDLYLEHAQGHYAQTGYGGGDLLEFFHDRLRVYLRDAGHRHDIIDAVLAKGGDDLLTISQRVEALGALLGTDDGVNLVQGYKRAANILRAERKKGALPEASEGAFTAPEAEALSTALDAATPTIDAALANGDYPAALDALAGLRAPIDAFFEGVMVNSDDPAERARRLGLLVAVEDTFARIADFSRLDG